MPFPHSYSNHSLLGTFKTKQSQSPTGKLNKNLNKKTKEVYIKDGDGCTTCKERISVVD